MAVQPQADAGLVAAYRSGDQLAAAALVRRYARDLDCFLYSLGADTSDIEDFAQETFFRAFRQLDGWRGTGSLRSWLLAIAANLVRDEYRKRKGRQVVAIEEYDLADPADPYEALTVAESEQRIRRGVAKLSQVQREVFLMRVQGGSEYAEIATALGMTQGAARVHYHRALKRLKELVR